MTIKTYNKTNFHKYTFCVFQEVALNEVNDLRVNFKSKSGSSYYFVDNGVYRLSNHWGRAANCKWRLINDKTVTLSTVEVPNYSRTKLGFAKWTDFYPDNDYEKLYFLQADYLTQTVEYHHKLSSNYTEDKILRTASETTKLIKQIRTLFEETAWAKYLNSDDIEELQKKIIEELIHTNQSFQEIRRRFI
jgi:hypothetical protein